ncbi:hypothetical protein FRB95_005871 [Tulasnella sp. JGI-2019a]|nr:hypothetical protein FRB93_002322 [Tulasnella sp. JGI-2019a]KAG9028956.1 hypothetical protein FRB95_005871 [Tulasnella sp. JGI-2019a]
MDKALEIVGHDKLLDPASLGHVFVSPRIRAQKTFELLFSSLPELPPHSLSDEAREWDYGEYEGLTPAQIAAKRPGWSIWTDGCPGGESVEQMTQRVDSLIAKIHELHRQYYEEGKGLRDIMVVAHGHLSRVLVVRWLDLPLKIGTKLVCEPAGISVLSYVHKSLKEPALERLNV